MLAAVELAEVEPAVVVGPWVSLCLWSAECRLSYLVASQVSILVFAFRVSSVEMADANQISLSS